ncbi:MAG: Fic family protein [Oscillospiraceae bacterium]|nr:Fic family protein [Oscillospiraceae bacterium]
MDFPKIEELRKKLAGMRPLNGGELKRLRDEFIVGSTYHSNAIEGSSLTLRETALILGEGVTVAEKPLREHLDAIGHRDAFEYISDLSKEKAPISEKVIKDIHSLVLMGDRENRGVYRSVPVTIAGSEHTPPQPYFVPEQMERLITDYSELCRSTNIIEAAAEFHLRFETIHPFIDGNGRTGRLILNLELMKNGLLPVNIKFTDRARYYDAFDSYSRIGSPSALAEMIELYEQEELERYIGIIEGKGHIND